MTFRLIRVSLMPGGTYGVISADGKPFAVTLERPWLNNQKKVSCIPPGVYECRKFKSPTHPKTYQLVGVPGRDAILIHVGNVVSDSEGCILLGKSYGDVKGQYGILQSRPAFEEFLQYAGEAESFTLEIKEV